MPARSRLREDRSQRLEAELGLHLGQRRIGQRAAIRELHGRHRLVASVDSTDVFGRGWVLFDVDLGVVDAGRLQLRFADGSIRTRWWST